MTMKKILFALLTGWMAISFTACDDFLTETPSTSVPTEEALVTTQDFQNAFKWCILHIRFISFSGT